jgi:hypothetical protein
MIILFLVLGSHYTAATTTLQVEGGGEKVVDRRVCGKFVFEDLVAEVAKKQDAIFE